MINYVKEIFSYYIYYFFFKLFIFRERLRIINEEDNDDEIFTEDEARKIFH